MSYAKLRDDLRVLGARTMQTESQAEYLYSHLDVVGDRPWTDLEECIPRLEAASSAVVERIRALIAARRIGEDGAAARDVTALDWAENLDAAPRLGAEWDEPEGSRYIVLSDTLARQLSAALRSRPLDPRVAASMIHCLGIRSIGE